MPDRVWALHTEEPIEALDPWLPALESAGLLGVAEQDGRATAYLADRVDGGPPGRWEEVPQVDWNAESRRHLRATTVGAITVTPPWLVVAEPDGVQVVIDPGQAFGTGAHETTTGCLAALQELDLAGRRVLDVGTGSGVLAIAALLLGAAEAVGVDVDPEAVAAARANAALNGVVLDVREGSVGAAPEGPYDVVVANLDSATFTVVAADVAAAVAPGGDLVASGVAIERADEAVARFEAAGLPVRVRPGREWVVLLGHRGPAGRQG